MEYVGIDVGKDELQVCVLNQGQPQRRFENKEKGWRALTRWLKTWGEVWVALEATGVYGDGVSEWLVAVVPQFAGVESEIILLITFVASVLIGGTAWEDAARLRQEAGAKAGLTTEERIRDAVGAVLDELLAAREAKG